MSGNHGSNGRDQRDRWRPLWPFSDVNTRFLNSDFLANYSRGYIWAANQLGHFTLGLIGALAYFWFSDTLFRAFTAPDLIGTNFGKLGSGGAESYYVNWTALWDVLFGVLALVLAALFTIGLLLIARKFFNKPRRLKQLIARRKKRLEEIGVDTKPFEDRMDHLMGLSKRRLQAEIGERWLAGIGLACLLALVGFILSRSFNQTVLAAYEWRAYAGSVMLTTFFFMILAAQLSQSARYTMMSWVALLAAAVMWEPRIINATEAPIGAVEGLPGIPNIQLNESLLVLIGLAVIFILLLVSKRRPDVAGPGSPSLLLFVGVTFLLAAFVTDPEWRRACAAAFASLAVWWVKEFGADIPTVQRELEDANFIRQINGAGEVNGVKHQDDYEAVRKECIDDTLCDARTDGLFYMAGAAMAVGLLAAPSVADVDSARAVPALSAALLFLLIYWIFGWRWIRRAVALDRIHVVAAHRFAMIETPFVTHIMVGDQPYAPTDAENVPAGPMQRLNAFARGKLTIGAGVNPQRVQHMVICGPFGSGRSELGHALACEATLADVPPLMSASDRWNKPKRAMRWAQYASLRGVFERRMFKTKNRFQIELEDRVGKPDMFVVDDADPYAQETIRAFRAFSALDPSQPADSAAIAELQERALTPLDTLRTHQSLGRSRMLQKVMELLYIDVGKLKDGAPADDETAWVVFSEVDKPIPGSAWTPGIPDEARQFAADLRTALAARSKGALAAEDIPIAIVVVGRPDYPVTFADIQDDQPAPTPTRVQDTSITT